MGISLFQGKNREKSWEYHGISWEYKIGINHMKYIRSFVVVSWEYHGDLIGI
jgi:hypothetical protein